MEAAICFNDLRFLRVAARRWAKEHPENPNSNRVMQAVDNCHPTEDWQLTVSEMEERGMSRNSH